MSTKPLVMVVEDEKLLLEAITKKLGLMGFAVEGFGDGRVALARLKEIKQLPDLIWLDFYLGDFNGDMFLQEMRKILVDKWIPVMIVSNSASPEKVDESMKKGAGKYLLKADYKLEELVKFAKEMINSH